MSFGPADCYRLPADRPIVVRPGQPRMQSEVQRWVGARTTQVCPSPQALPVISTASRNDHGTPGISVTLDGTAGWYDVRSLYCLESP